MVRRLLLEPVIAIPFHGHSSMSFVVITCSGAFKLLKSVGERRDLLSCPNFRISQRHVKCSHCNFSIPNFIFLFYSFF